MSLTPQEDRAIRAYARGLNRTQVAAEMGVSVRTADVHIQHASAKLGLSGRIDVIKYGFRQGWVTVDEFSAA